MNEKVAENIKEKEEASSELDQAFVKEEARVLDPKLLKRIIVYSCCLRFKSWSFSL